MNLLKIITGKIKKLNIQRWKKGIPKEDQISFLLFAIYLSSLFFIWVLPVYIKLIDVNPISIPIETIIGWIVTLVAIIPTLTLTAAQLASGAYTYKIVSLYKKEPYFWILLIMFLLTILMGISLKMFDVSDPRVLLTFHSTALFSILFLFPYFLNTLTSIGFEANVDRLINQIKLETLIPILFENKKSLNPNIRDPFFDARPILEKAIQENDLPAFGIVLNKLAFRYEEILKEIIKKPITFNPKFGPTPLDSLMGSNASQRLWTFSAINKLSELWFNHMHAIQKSTSGNEPMLIEFSSIVNNFSIVCDTLLLPLKDAALEDIFGQKIRYLLTTIAKDSIRAKQLDSVAQCIDSLENQGCYGAQNNIRDVTYTSKGYLEEIQNSFMRNFNEWNNFDRTFILGRLLNAHKEIIINQMNFQEWEINEDSFEKPLEISKIILVLGLQFGAEFSIEGILVPILLQYYSNGKEENLRKATSTINEVIPINQGIIFQSFKVTLDRYQRSGQKPSHFYHDFFPKDWLSLMIGNLDSIISAINSSELRGKPEEIIRIYEDLAVIAYRMEDYDLVLDLLKRHFNANISLSKANKHYLLDPYSLPVCLIYLCLVTKKDDLALALIREMSSYGKHSSKNASQVTHHFTYLGSYAIYLKNEYISDFIVNQIIGLEETFPNYKNSFGTGLGSLRTSANLSGYNSQRYFSNPYFRDHDKSPIIYRLTTKLEEIDDPPQKCASIFMKKLVAQFLILAIYRANLLKNKLMKE
ncbi:MAG: hypothetical protein O8C62_00990 [Candidatus Methanoperedens sp.]|nr:hypothetical protein [Candidatus Methanoperedens sp.]